MIKKYIVIIASAFILALLIAGCSNENDSWAAEVKEITANADAVQYKYRAIETLEREYTATIAQLERFYMDLTNSFQSGEYLNGVDDEEVLENIFRAIVLANQATGEPQQFASMYLENMKYTYLNINEPTSDQILANEKLMSAILNNAL